jgi:MoaA/NifB/PqqE/SkfB family radical SAM enzyme
MKMIKRHYLFLDLGFYSACNLQCAYCRGEIVEDKKDFGLSKLIDQIEAFQERFCAGTVKVSGYGEITMWSEFAAALDYLRDKFPMVQVITNGTFGDDIADVILAHQNVSPNITIDGHTMTLNSVRVRGNAEWHKRTLANLKRFAAEGRAVEVNCVLHQRNTGGLADFCEYLSEFGQGRIMLFPFPVKSFDRAPEVAAKLKGGFRQLAEELDSIYEKHHAILPPKGYIDDLKDFLLRDLRTNHCHIHWANLGSGSRNERLHCANYGEELSYGPMLESLTVNSDRIHQEEAGHLQHGEVGPRCAKCFNHYHVINLFLEGRITLEELQSLPSLRAPEIGPIARRMKDEFLQAYNPAEKVVQSILV